MMDEPGGAGPGDASRVVPARLNARADEAAPIPRDAKSKPSHVVGIGASAGGLEALERFFDRLPPDTGMAFVVVQHLSPDFKSLMDELLARHTPMPVRRVSEGMELEPNAVYVIQPKQEIIVQNGRVHLTAKDPAQPLSLPIDLFLRSLAKDSGKNAIAVILSGTGSDGSRGVVDVHAKGGLVLVQDEESAKFNGMPRSAVDTGVADFILPPGRMAEAILRHASASGQEIPLSPQPRADARGSDEHSDIFVLLKAACGIDFTYYKPSTVHRRIERRMSMHGFATLDAYLARLGVDPSELDALYKDLLIGVTRFFRDQEAFRVLEREALPGLVADLADGDELRLWSPGCATGEEAYSLAILAVEAVEAARRRLSVKVFATDVHKDSLARAAAGVYGETTLEHVSAERRKRHFIQRGDEWQVAPELRKAVVFAEHNIIKDPPFTKMDLISCRNLLIYFQPIAQKKAVSLLHFALKTGGVLFLGPSESLADLEAHFEAVERHWKIYRKIRDTRLPGGLRLPLNTEPRRAPGDLPPPQPAASGMEPRITRVYDLILDRFMPPSVLVDENREILHTFGDAGRYLKPRGRASLDLLQMVDGDLRLALSTALQKAAKTLEKVSYKGVSAGGESHSLTLVVDPVVDSVSRQTHLLVTFEHDEGSSPANEHCADFKASEGAHDRISQLEQELRYAHENLKATVEELETSNEELQASNEELLASNEELQSTNEELHSVNEELYTVNGELEAKIRELTALNNDIDNLLRATDIGTLFLDRNLRIRKFTPAIAKSFKLLPHDLGRPIDHISYHIVDHGEMLDDMRRVLETGARIEREVTDSEGAWLLMRMLAYRDEHGDIQGLVVTFIDITDIKSSSEALRKSEERFALAMQATRDGLWDHDVERGAIYFSPGFKAVLGREPEEEVGAKDFLDALHPDDRHLWPDLFDAQPLLELDEFESELRLRPLGGDWRWVLSRSRVMSRSAEGLPSRVVGTLVDVTSSYEARSQLGRQRELFQTILDNIPVLITMYDADLRVRLLTREFERVIGWSTEEAREIDLMAVCYPDPGLRRAASEHMRKPGSEWKDFPTTTRSGSMLQVAWANVILSDDSRIGIGIDVTTRKLMESEILSAKELAEAASSAKSQFLANVSHEIRTPMTGLLGMIQLAMRGDLDQNQRGNLTLALESGQNLLAILNDIIDLAKVEAGKLELADEPFDPRELAHSTIAMFSYQAQQKGLTLECFAVSATPRKVHGDPLRLRQVLINLVGNAVKFTDKGRIDLEIYPDERRADYLRFIVRDTGCGIPKGKLEQIFESFNQADGSLGRRHQGAGLGLSISRRIVQLMGGSIEVKSTEGKGSIFSFDARLPQDAAEPAGLAADESGYEEQAKPGAGRKILVAEDNFTNQLFISGMLEGYGFSVDCAGNGEEALDMLALAPYDAVLMDVQMPIMDGIEATARIRKHNGDRFNPDIPIIALTAHAMKGDREKFLAAGMNDYLPKPVDIPALLRMLDGLGALGAVSG